ncbi:uncharacterized protein J3R85_020879 [Psidium guajava]|nr:uncharacterized protein J3R85_020879 [Psidium guajava]
MVLAKILRFVAISPSGDLRYAHHLFDQIPQPIRGYSSSSPRRVSMDMFNQMRRKRVDPDESVLLWYVV